MLSDAVVEDFVAVAHGSNWPEPARKGYGQSTAALPGTSDVDFLGDLKRVVDLNAEVADGAFDPMASGP
jgi:hypothetical protein